MTDLTSGLITRVDTGQEPPVLHVDALDWTSPFRGGGVAVGDVIVAVDGVAVDPAATGGAASQLIGQFGEASAFEKAGRKAGDRLTLTLRRRAFPQGWQEIKASAALVERPNWRDARNEPILGPGGPEELSSDEFPESWGGWVEPFQRKLQQLLDPELMLGSFTSQFEAKDFAERNGARVAFAVAHYPGKWSAAVKDDYDRALAAARGAAVTLPPGALDYRRRGEELAAEVRAQAQAGWEAVKAAVAGDTVAAFPATDPIHGDVDAVKGKAVVLPPVGNSGFVADCGHTWFAITAPDGDGGDGWYFVDAEDEVTQAVLEAQHRYTRLVDPNLPASWEFLCRLDGGSRLGVVGERAWFGLIGTPLAALVGAAMFVDLARRKGTEVAFAGEAVLVDDTPNLPPDAATPADVLIALVGAVKTGDIALWRALHADWEIERLDDGTLVVHPHALPPDDDVFEESKRSIMARVLDARPAWTGDPVIVTDGSRFPGALRIEEVEAWLTHIGSFDGETRSFNDVTVNARWTLTRLNGGPWRIAKPQSI